MSGLENCSPEDIRSLQRFSDLMYLSYNNPQEIQRENRFRKVLVYAMCFTCLNLIFIIPDLIYAYGKSECVTFQPEGISFNLSVWLLVDGYLRIGIPYSCWLYS